MRDEQMKALSDRLAASQARSEAIRARVAEMRQERKAEGEQMKTITGWQVRWYGRVNGERSFQAAYQTRDLSIVLNDVWTKAREDEDARLADVEIEPVVMTPAEWEAFEAGSEFQGF
jgi:hypothetical protein